MNDLYWVISQEKNDSGLMTIIGFNPNHQVFKDHFPGNPVVPGVILMQLVREILEKKTSQKLELVECAEVKFLKTITPQQDEPIIINIQEVNELQIKSEIWLTGYLCFKMRATYKRLVKVL